MIAPLRLRRHQRLGAADVAAALKDGKIFRSPRLVLYRRSNAQPCARLALIVPKKLVRAAVARNRVRRLAREAFRLRQSLLAGQDCVLRVVKPQGEAPVTLLEIDALLQRAIDG